MVLVEDVKTAVTTMKEAPSENAGLKILLDWIKRVAFLFIGFSVVQGANVLHQENIEKGSVIWLMIDILFAAVLAGLALAADIPGVRRAIGGASS